ncbi:MAG: hypothetical protein JXA23_02510 [Bacteroidales bacterium]|nr:hypothetical protein [Bacteroidales bacterium]
MNKQKEAAEYTVSGHKLECPVCHHTKFTTRRTLMNTAGMTFLGIEWANREATNYICGKCGYVMWFMEP